MAIVEAWESLLPADGDALSDGDNKIRDFKRAVRERMVNGGIKWEPNGGATTDQDAGKLTCGVQGTTGILTLIENEAEVVVCTVRDGTDAGGNKQFEVGDSIGGAEQYDLRAHTMTARDFTMSGSGTADLSAGATLIKANTFHEQSIGTSTSAFGALTGSATWDSIHSGTAFTTRAGTAGPILLMWQGSFLGSSGTNRMSLRIKRATTVIATYTEIMDEGAVDSRQFTLFFLDTGATAATSTQYHIEAEELEGTISHLDTQMELIALELRNDIATV